MVNLVNFSEADLAKMISRDASLRAALRECAAIACDDPGEIGTKICDHVAQTMRDYDRDVLNNT